MNGHGHDFGHEFVSDADSDTRFFGTSDTDLDTNMGSAMTSVTGSDTHMSENLGLGFGHEIFKDFGHGLGPICLN